MPVTPAKRGASHKSVEQQPARTGGAAIEAEREFVQIIVQMTRLHCTLVRPQQPTFQQGRYAVGQRQKIVPQSWRRADHFVFVAQVLQPVVALPSVGADRGPDLHSL